MTIRIAIIGSGISAISFYYALMTYLKCDAKFYVIAGEEMGMENNIEQAHGHQISTNFLGLGGTANVWGGVLKPYERHLKYKNNLEREIYNTASLSLNVAYGWDIWKRESSLKCSKKNYFERSYFAINKNIEKFWQRRAPLISRACSLTILRNTGCKKISKNKSTWSIELSGISVGDHLNDIDYVFIGAGIFHTEKIIKSSEISKNFTFLPPADHKMGVIGRLKLSKKMFKKEILPTFECGKYAFSGRYLGHSFTLYLQPCLPRTVTSSKGQDVALAISAIRDPLMFLKRAGIRYFLTTATFINIIMILKIFFFGDNKYDILYISEQKRSARGLTEILDKERHYQGFTKYIEKNFEKYGKFIPLSHTQSQAEMLSAIHRTSRVLSSDRNVTPCWDRPIVIDASGLHRTSSFNPSLEICIHATRIAYEFSDFLNSRDVQHD